MNCNTQSDHNIKRVGQHINRVIINFCKERMKDHFGIFTLTDLEIFVSSQVKTTPGSAGRILRNLNKLGLVSYYCSDRAKSTYVVHQVMI